MPNPKSILSKGPNERTKSVRLKLDDEESQEEEAGEHHNPFIVAWTSISSIFSHSHSHSREEVEVNLEGEQAEGQPEEDEEKVGHVVFICTHEDSARTKSVAVCDDQSFEIFMDLIQNEFGEQFWPVLNNISTGFQKLIDTDEKFEYLVEEAEVCNFRCSIHSPEIG